MTPAYTTWLEHRGGLATHEQCLALAQLFPWVTNANPRGW